ncbi:MAG: MBL fold metallo-hydrolase [Blastocatellia bacterium]
MDRHLFSMSCAFVLRGVLLLFMAAGAPAYAQPGGPPADTAILNDGQLHVILVGTGSPLVDATRAASCVAIIAGGQVILVDTGPGSWRKFGPLGIPQEAVGTVLLTHFHSDHFGDLGEVMTMSWTSGRPKPLQVYGPPGVDRVVAGFNQAYAQDIDYRVAHHGEKALPRAAAGAQARVIKPGKPGEAMPVFEQNGVRVIAFAVEHDPVKPAYGYRIDYQGRSVVISGDTLKSANLTKHAAGADLLLHDAMARDILSMGAANLERAGQTRRAGMVRDILTYHASTADAAATAAAANVETLVLTHLVPVPATPMIEQAFTRGLAEIFKGKVVLAKDGLRFDLPPKK